MEKIRIAIIGGGASGLMLANALDNTKGTVVFERGERLGRKLSATGNGQGNLTNLGVVGAEYFSVCKNSPAHIKKAISAYDDKSMREFFRTLGVLSIADERGRVYPSSRQASALTDALRFSLAGKGVLVRTETQVTDLKSSGDGFILTLATKAGEEKVYAEKVVLCAGGKAAKNFGTDGSAYALAQGFGHTLTKLYPSLVQLKTDVKHTKTLKGIRVNDGVLRAKGAREYSVQGDIIFTDYGVSGDAVFRLSAFIADTLSEGKWSLEIDFLPQYTEKEILSILQEKQKIFPAMDKSELLFGIVNNQIGRAAVMRRAGNDIFTAAKLVKSFSVAVTGSLGFDYAQVTKGGIPLGEVTQDLESTLKKGLYFAGEILDADGQCGGFNLQWAYSSARTVAKALNKK